MTKGQNRTNREPKKQKSPQTAGHTDKSRTVPKYMRQTELPQAARITERFGRKS
jgi:hypothetical protein